MTNVYFFLHHLHYQPYYDFCLLSSFSLIAFDAVFQQGFRSILSHLPVSLKMERTGTTLGMGWGTRSGSAYSGMPSGLSSFGKNHATPAHHRPTPHSLCSQRMGLVHRLGLHIHCPSGSSPRLQRRGTPLSNNWHRQRCLRGMNRVLRE